MAENTLALTAELFTYNSDEGILCWRVGRRGTAHYVIL
jgi:hypothetical protein